VVTPDLAAKLPGRGAWVSANRAAVDEAVKRRAFARAFDRDAAAENDLGAQVESALARAALSALGLARRSGDAVVGFEKVRSALAASKAAVLVEASDGAPDGKKKLAAVAGATPVVACFDRGSISAALGTEAVHAAIGEGRAATRFLEAASRFEAFTKDGKR
jgi:ribosomal protein L7Ae-like RNA K-turn-binding protein